MANSLQMNLAGGINRKVTPLILADEECELLINYHLDQVGAITKRKGVTQEGDQPVANSEVRGLFYDRESNDYVMVVNESLPGSTSTIYTKSPTATSFNAEKTGDPYLTENSDGYIDRARFVNFVGRFFRLVGGNGPMLSASSATVTYSTSDCLTTESPQFIAVYQDRIYAARDESTGKQNRVWYSSLPDSSFNLTWDATADGQWFDVNPDDGDVITGIENNGNRLLIFKHRALYRWTFGLTEPDRLIGVGAVNQEVIQTNFDVGITFFANPYGVYAYSGNRPRLISRKIQDIIDAVTDAGWQNACAGVDNDHYYLSVGEVEIDDRTYNNVVLVYHISLDAWSVYSMHTRPSVFANMPDNTDETAPRYLYFGGADGRVYRMNFGSTDNGAPISAYFRSKEYMIRYPEKVSFQGVDVFSNKRGNTQLRMDVDRSDITQNLGPLTSRVTNFGVEPHRIGNSIRLYATDNSDGESQIEGFNIQYDLAVKRDQHAQRLRRYG